MRVRLLSPLVFAMLCACGLSQTTLPSYMPAQRVVGTIRSSGSPQMGELLNLWEAGFQKFQPDIRFQNDLRSTSSAIAGLDLNHADIALLGRDLWPAEVLAFQSTYGYRPTSVQVATGSYDVPKATYALMLFVQADNPLTELSIEQLQNIFGAEDASHSHEIRTWGELGLEDAWVNRDIHPYGFDLKNDKAIFFQAKVLKGTRRWNGSIVQFSNSTSGPRIDAGQLILNALANDRDGIAISNIHYAVAGVKVLAIGRDHDGPFIAPARQSVQARSYPLARPVHIVVRRDPRRGIDPKVREFLRYILSSQGQRDVSRQKDYLPLANRVAISQRSILAAK